MPLHSLVAQKLTLSHPDDSLSVIENHSPSRPDDGLSVIEKKFISKIHSELVCAGQADVIMCEPSGHETSICVCQRTCAEFQQHPSSGNNFRHFR